MEPPLERSPDAADADKWFAAPAIIGVAPLRDRIFKSARC
jgi:hypothetical protein